MRRWYALGGIVFLMSGSSVMADSVAGYDRVTGLPHASRSEVIAPHGMAATSQPLATQIALDILKAGGNAVDAAIAANAALGLMEPTGCGIGGDLFAIVWDAENQELTGLNASGRAPAAMTIEYFRERGIEEIPPLGPLPVSVPGAVDGWYELHGRYGRLPMRDILAPAISYAKGGFPVSEVIAYYMARNKRHVADYPGFAETYMPGGDTPGKGEIFRNPRLAKTYEMIAEGGRDVFYKGEIARTIGDFMQANGGFLSYEDLAAHTSEWVEPVSTDYRGYRVWELPPNGQGIAALQMLQILEGYDVGSMPWHGTEMLHLYAEAWKRSYADRNHYLADPDFIDMPLERMTSLAYAQERRQAADDRVPHCIQLVGNTTTDAKFRHPRGPVFNIPFGSMGTVKNNSRDYIISKLDFRVRYDTDVNKVRKIIKKINKKIHKIHKSKFCPYLREMMLLRAIQSIYLISMIKSSSKTPFS